MTSTIRKHLPLILIIIVFSIFYSLLSLVRHQHYNSFGYDLGIDDQIVWKYSQGKIPVTTIDDVPYWLSLQNHLELVYLFLAPFYWLWNNVSTLLVLQSLFFVISAVPVFLLARHYHLKNSVSYALVLAYLIFFGVQNALWFDAHSSPFGTAFLMWFIYYLEKKNLAAVLIFLVFTMTSKEHFAFLTFLVCLVSYLKKRDKLFVIAGMISLIYLFLIFGFYFPRFNNGAYHYGPNTGLFSGFDLSYLIDTLEKKQVFLFSLLSFGFLPLLSPLALIPFFGDLASYFILGRNVYTAQGLFLHYRIELAPLLVWPAIKALSQYKILNRKSLAVYLLVCTFFLQYYLHLPLSYLSKSWFWHESSAVDNIDALINTVPKNSAVVSQNNITPHLSHRDEIFTLWPQMKTFKNNSPCRLDECNWFSWGGNPRYLVVDLSPQWDIRHLLSNREEFIAGVYNLKKAGLIKEEKRIGNAYLYKIIRKPY